MDILIIIKKIENHYKYNQRIFYCRKIRIYKNEQEKHLVYDQPPKNKRRLNPVTATINNQ